MADNVGATVGMLLFLLGIVAWTWFTGAIPFPVPSEVSVVAILGFAIVSLLTYSQLDPDR